MTGSWGGRGDRSAGWGFQKPDEMDQFWVAAVVGVGASAASVAAASVAAVSRGGASSLVSGGGDVSLDAPSCDVEPGPEAEKNPAENRC